MPRATCGVLQTEDKLVELEPIGPRETIAAGAEASFTEEWYLLPMEFPAEGEQVDLAAFTRTVETQTGGPASAAEPAKL